MPCLKCGSDKRIPSVVVRTSDLDTIKVEVKSHPTALLFTGKVIKPLFACVCGACGFTELYAEDPQELFQAYQTSQE